MVLQEILESNIISIVQFVLVIGIGYVATKLIADGLTRYFKKPSAKKFIAEMGYEEPISDLIVVMVRYVLYFITFIIALSQFGFATIVFDIVIIIISLFVVFLIFYSLKDFITNAAAGMYLHRFKTIAKGNKIRVGNYSGEITDMNLMAVTLKDEFGRIIIIPNSTLTHKEIIKGEGLEK